MTDRADVVVAGGGLAGATVALVLSRTRRVIVLDARDPDRATDAAAGLLNPFPGQKAAPAWQSGPALDALAALADEAGGGWVRRTGVLRPAVSEAQAAAFRERAPLHDGLDWLTASASGERWPQVSAPLGTLVVRDGGSVPLAAFVRAMLAEVVRRGGEVRRARLASWRPGFAITDHGEIRSPHLVLALGDGVRQLAALAGLPLHRVKGQTLSLARPPGLDADHPPVAGRGYLVPDADRVIAGATFEHVFATTAPDPTLDAGLAERAGLAMPALAGAPVLERRAGVRITVPAAVSPRRLPLAGPLPGHPGVWIVSGLGAKGLLTAPLIAQLLPDALDGRPPTADGRQALPAELWPAGVG